MKNVEGITIKQWLEDDWQTFKAIRLEAVTLNSRYYLTNFETEFLKDDEYWKLSLRDTYNGNVFGIYDGNIAIGLMGAFRHREHKDDTAIFGMVYVREEYRGMKLSDRLYNACLEWAKAQKGIKRILISHRDDNHASKSIIQKMGFQFYEEAEITYGDASHGLSCRYELKI